MFKTNIYWVITQPARQNVCITTDFRKGGPGTPASRAGGRAGFYSRKKEGFTQHNQA